VAAFFGDEEVMRFLARNPRYAVTQEALSSAPMSAAKIGALAVVDFLLGEITDFLPETSERYFNLAERLLQDPRITISGRGALKEACEVQNVQLAHTLLDDPRGLSAKDKSEALIEACGLPETDVLLRLLADPDINPNESCYRYGSEEFPLEANGDSTKLEFFRALLAHPKIDLKLGGGKALIACREKGLVDHLKELLARSEIDINLPYKYQTPLDAACTHKHIEVAGLLLCHGADPYVSAGSSTLTTALKNFWRHPITSRLLRMITPETKLDEALWFITDSRLLEEVLTSRLDFSRHTSPTPIQFEAHFSRLPARPKGGQEIISTQTGN